MGLPCLPSAKGSEIRCSCLELGLGTDCSRNGSWLVCCFPRAGLRAGAYPRHADRREGRNDQVQTAKGETVSIKLANDAGLFLVTKADMSAIQSGKFVGITSFEQDGKRVARGGSCV